MNPEPPTGPHRPPSPAVAEGPNARSEPALPAPPATGADLPAGLAFLLVFILLAVGVVVSGVFYYRHLERRFRADGERSLATIADLKMSELVQYRKERLADGTMLSNNAAFAGLVRRFLEQPAAAEGPRELQAWLEMWAKHFRYDQARLLDAQGVTRLSAPAGLPPVSSIVAANAMVALRSNRVIIQDFYRSENDQQIRLGLLIPVFAELDANRPLGVIFLRISPEAYLFPFIKRWPVPTESAETLLVRREGNEVVFLNELRFQKDTALNRRVPLATGDMPAVQAALGRERVMDGIDYRGVPVVAATRTIPDSPWFMVARMDAAEFGAALRPQLLQLLAAIGILLFSAGVGVAGLWWRLRARFFRAEATAAAEIHQLNLTLEQRVSDRTAKLEASIRELAAFSYSVAHDLRSPLRAMDGFSAALLEDYADQLDETGLDHLRRIRGGSQRMGLLIDDLLSLSHEARTEMKRQRVDVTALVGEIGETLQRAQPNHQPEWVVAPALAAEADPRMLRVVLTNLLGNAWKFTSQRAGARIEVGVVAPAAAGGTVFFVRDNGVGFDMAYADKLFGSFQRLHSQHEFAGTGIGLALVQRIIHRHGGQVWATGKVNEGATFFFTLGQPEP